MAPDDQRARLHANGSLCVVLREPDGTFTATVTHKDHGGHRDLRLPSQDAAMKACDAEIALRGHTCTEECDSW